MTEPASPPAVQDRQPLAPTGPEPRRRLHPLSPLLRGGRLIALAVAAISWRGYQELGTQDWLLAIGGVMVLVLIGSVISWAVTGYHVVDRELRVYEGLLWRRTRAIPLERLQAVELVQPLLARAVGLAELRLEVVGAAKTEAPLAFLTVEQATQLRARLLELSRGAQPRTADPAQPATLAAVAVPSERPVHTVATRMLVAAQLLRPQWWLVPLGIAAPIYFFAIGADLGFIAVASTLTAVIGAVQAPVRAILGEWGFTIASAANGLHIRRGLTERRSQTVPPGRIQNVTVAWPLLWRAPGWVRVGMRVAGISGRDQQPEGGGSLLPVGTVDDAERVIGEALDGVVLRSVALRRIPTRAALLAPLRQFVLGYELGPHAFATRDGLLTQRLTLVPYQRIQSVRLRQGPLQRLLRVASVFVDTAAGASVAAPHRDVAEAKALATALADRSRHARRPSADEPGPS